MQQGLGSEQMRKAGKDLCNFATGDVTMFAPNSRDPHSTRNEAPQ